MKLETQAGRNTVEILYKIVTGSEGNIMPLFMPKKLFKNTTEEQLQKSTTEPYQAENVQQNAYNTIRQCVQ